MREEGDPVNLDAELEESDSEDGEDVSSVPPAESEDDEEEKDEEPLVQRLSKKRGSLELGAQMGP